MKQGIVKRPKTHKPADQWDEWDGDFADDFSLVEPEPVRPDFSRLSPADVRERVKHFSKQGLSPAEIVERSGLTKEQVAGVFRETRADIDDKIDAILQDPRQIYIQYLKNAEYIKSELEDRIKYSDEDRDRVAAVRELRNLNKEILDVLNLMRNDITPENNNKESILLGIVKRKSEALKKKSPDILDDEMFDEFFKP